MRLDSTSALVAVIAIFGGYLQFMFFSHSPELQFKIETMISKFILLSLKLLWYQVHLFLSYLCGFTL